MATVPNLLSTFLSFVGGRPLRLLLSITVACCVVLGVLGLGEEASWRPKSSHGSALKDESALLQTSVQRNAGQDIFGGLALLDEGAGGWPMGALAENTRALAEGSAAAGSATVDDFCKFAAVKGCSYSGEWAKAKPDGSVLAVPAPLLLHQQLNLFQDLALLGRPGGNTSTEGVAKSITSGTTVASSKMSVEAAVLLGLYGLIYISITGSILYYMSAEVRRSPTKADKGRQDDIIEEDAVWRKSMVQWFLNSWATQWTSKWGHSLDAAMTKIRPEDLPKSICDEKHPWKCCCLFNELWAAEVQSKGVGEARLLAVLVRFCGLHRLAYGTVLYLLKTLAKDCYVVLLLELALNVFRWIQSHNSRHPLEPVPLAPMVIAAVVFFSVHPLSIIFFSMLHSRIVRELEQEVCGGLGVAMYRKALRLPVCTPPSEEEDQGKVQHGGPDLKQLIMNDACVNMLFSWNNLNEAMYCVLQLGVMLVLLWRHVKTSVLLVVAGSWPIMMVLRWYCRYNGEAMRGIMYVEDYRNKRLQELFFNIRPVKCNAWELAMEKQCAAIRAVHLGELRKLFGRQMVMNVMLQVSPKALAVLTLASYLVFYGALDVSAIFAIIQIVNVIRGGTDGLTRCWTDLVSVGISLERIETFLRLEEAPLCRKEVPTYLKLWPSQESRASTLLQLHGSFRWTPSSPAVLQDLHLDVPRGSLVAICGEVGSGKSTLLQAILGELLPMAPKDSCLARPARAAYCPQNPVIYEGTLQENVLFGGAMQEQRYAEAIGAAGLAKDLESLPEGDGVMIGTRGIVLSGGQRARVQLARAAYCEQAELLLLDDPFGSVDAPTGEHIFQNLLLGPLAEGRTRIVVLQPEKERLVHFDHVLVLSSGRVAVQGRPDEVMASSHFHALLRSKSGDQLGEEGQEQEEPMGEPDTPSDRPPAGAGQGRQQQQPQQQQQQRRPPQQEEQQPAAKLRSEEEEGRPTVRHVQEYISRGRAWNLLMIALSMIAIEAFNLVSNLVLARWANRQASRGTTSGWFYVLGYIGCAVVIALANILVWLFVEYFSIALSKTLHEDIMQRLLQAPVDRFFDKHPVGRIMNRLTNDMRTVDRALLFSGMGLFALLGQLCIPVGFVHSSMPFYFSLWVLPTYYIIGTLWFRYWNTSVPLAYSKMVCLSSVMATIGDAHEHSVIVRAYSDEPRAVHALARTVSDALKLMMSRNVLEGWFMARLEVLWNFCTTFVVLFAVVRPGSLGVGTLGLCLTNMMLVQNNFMGLCSSASNIMSEFISFVRLSEYLEIPQERPAVLEGDERYRNFLVSCSRADMGKLVITRDSGILRVCRCPAGGAHPVALLHASEDGTGLVPTKRPAEVLRDLCPGCDELEAVTPWHHIACVNGAHGSAEQLAEELCSGTCEKVALDVRSGWLAAGARVQLQALAVGYADVPKEVLRGVHLTIEAGQKVGVVGETGCGKSTLLLALLRILEPRSGRILFNGVDTCIVGVRTLRSMVGLVAQEPVLFSGSIRYNLDPHGTFSDEQILQALERVQLRGLVDSLEEGLEHSLAEGGENISYGQRKLACLARCVMRRPALLLLDEATSSIDPRTQEIISEVLHKDFALSTLISVAHRLETLEDYDLVVVLQEGRVAERGPPAELAASPCGIFAGLLAARRRQLA